jgi:hypothetical protein
VLLISVNNFQAKRKARRARWRKSSSGPPQERKVRVDLGGQSSQSPYHPERNRPASQLDIGTVAG